MICTIILVDRTDRTHFTNRCLLLVLVFISRTNHFVLLLIDRALGTIVQSCWILMFEKTLGTSHCSHVFDAREKLHSVLVFTHAFDTREGYVTRTRRSVFRPGSDIFLLNSRC